MIYKIIEWTEWDIFVICYRILLQRIRHCLFAERCTSFGKLTQIYQEKTIWIHTFHIWKRRQDQIRRMLCWTATFWGHRFGFWLDFRHMRINSGRFTSSEIHECPASSSFPTTLDNVMHNIEFQPVCEFEPAFALKHKTREEPTQPRALNTKTLHQEAPSC